MTTIEDIRIVEDHYKFPFTLHDYQLRCIAEAADMPGSLNRAKVGRGKTVMSLYLGLYLSLKNDVKQILIIAPPSLIDQWEDFILSIGGIKDEVDVFIYRGTPKEREVMDVTRPGIVLVSNKIFLIDYEVFVDMGKRNKLFIIGDELSLKTGPGKVKINGKQVAKGHTYSKWKNLIYRKKIVKPGVDKPFHYFTALNATPISKLDQVYWWCGIFNPALYRNKTSFESQHVGGIDNWGNATSYINEDLLEKNMNSFSVIPTGDDIKEPEPVFIKTVYKLDKKHKQLYDQIQKAEFDEITGDIVEWLDAMFATLQRVVLCPKEFGLNIRSPIFDYIDSLLDQTTQEDKVIIYTRHVMVSKMITEYLGDRCVAYFGGIGRDEKSHNLRLFKYGNAQVLVANLDSLSKGQNLQMANHTLFVELPFTSDILTQACGRTKRQGSQFEQCFYHMPVAKGTIQIKLLHNLVTNDSLLKEYNKNPKALIEYLKSA